MFLVFCFGFQLFLITANEEGSIFTPILQRRKLTLRTLNTWSNEPNLARYRTILRRIKLLVNNYILNACYVPGFILGTRKIAMNSTNKKHCPHGAYSSGVGSLGRQ